jgi:serine/threonine protein phosphatase PrpC
MGGHEGGQIASRTVIDFLDCAPDLSSEAAFVDSIRARLDAANRQIGAISQQHFAGRVIGSTVTVLIAYECKAVCLWVGDSRFYLFRDGRLRQVNRDHTAIADLVEQDLLSTEEIDRHRLRNVITRAIGARDELEVDYRDEEIRSGDVLLLCTDGLNKVVSDKEIAGTLSGGTSERMAEELMCMALARNVPDNVTVCVVQVEDPSMRDGDELDKTAASTEDTMSLAPHERPGPARG